MTRIHTSLFAAALVSLGVLAGSATAGGDLTITRSTIDGGGGTMSGGPFTLRGSIGQHDAALGPISQSDFDVLGGFWTPLLIESSCRPDLNEDDELDFFDVLMFLEAFSAEDPIADFNDDLVFDFFDVLEFLNAYSSGCP